MPGKNFRRLNEKSCLDCTHKQRSDMVSICDIDGLAIKDSADDRTGMPLEFVCDEFDQVDWEAKKKR
jgi:hypothetical protein